MFFRTDDPVRDAERYIAEQEAALEKRPKCSECSEHIQDEHYFDIHGMLYCEECMNENFRKDIEDF